MDITILDKEHERQYDEFLLKSPKTLFFASNKYRMLLRKVLGCRDYYLLAMRNGEIVGALPCFVKENQVYGNILNSLPYYGSNGAIIEHEGNTDVKDALINAPERLCEEIRCVASTVVTSPFETDISFYRKRAYDFTDSRRGLVTHLPRYREDIEQRLMALFDSKRRNNIRKAQKSMVQVQVDNTEDSFSFLYETHLDNMTQVGGKPKERRFFDTVKALLEPGVDYDIYTAELEGKRVSALLVFYFNKTVEYFTPVIVHDYRVYQPLCLILLYVMIDAAKKGYENINWGGTGGAAQEGVYHFKKDFGATDYLYYYFTKIYDDSILSMLQKTVLEEYKDFYVFPFEQVREISWGQDGVDKW